MKRVTIAFFSLAIVATASFAQQNDTIRVIKPVLPENILPSKDSLLQDKSKMDLGPVPKPLRPNKDFIRQNNQYSWNLDLPKIKQKRTIFNSPYSKFIIPTTMITFGVLTRNTKSYEEMNIPSVESGYYNGKKTSIDDYLRYAPYLGIYAPDLVGIKAKHNLRDRTFVMMISFIIMDRTVNVMKTNIPTWRPDGSNQRSFPSSHTSVAFVGAHIMFKEYKYSSPWVASSGYIAATATGVLRMVNEKHSFADVTTGAGVAMLSVEAGYLLLLVFHSVFRIKDEDKGKNLVVIPAINTESIGLGLSYTF